MIDEQHPMQIGMFPLDIKCHTPQQLQQIHLQQQQQQQTNMYMNGNERMLTTSTTAAAAAAAVVGGVVVPLQTTSAATTTSAAPNTNGLVNDNGIMSTIVSATQSTTSTTTTLSSKSTFATHNDALSGKSGNITTPITARTTPTTNVNGSINNHNNNNSNINHNNSNSLNINSASSNSSNSINNNNNTNNTNNQLTTPIGGPGPPHSLLLSPNATNVLTSVSAVRATLSECNLNSNSNSLGTICSNSNCNGNINSNNNNINCNGIALSLQQQLQLHTPQILGNLSQHHQHQPLHPAAALIASNANGIDVASISDALSIVCGYCCQPICDRYIMRVVDTSFHESCLKCATCSLHLVHSCFARDGKLYCRIDYERLFIRNRCLGCGHKIACDELVMRTLENVFHLKCFACVVCGALLKKGEQYVVKQGQLFCRFDYEKEVEMLQGYDFYGDDLFPPKMDGRRGPKRPRTILNTQQRRAFKASFELSPKPCRKVRENLAKETGLSLRIVQVWFQNQRAKVKKIQKKAKQEHTKGTSDSQDSQESDSSLAKIKDEAHSDNESLLESPFSSCGAGGGSSSDGAAKLRCIKDENENAPFNCMETNKENCNKTNEPILNTILGLSYATFQQLMGPFTQTPTINPIDRLYSMQNSYFRPEEMNYNDCGKEVGEN